MPKVFNLRNVSASIPLCADKDLVQKLAGLMKVLDEKVTALEVNTAESRIAWYVRKIELVLCIALYVEELLSRTQTTSTHQANPETVQAHRLVLKKWCKDLQLPGRIGLSYQERQLRVKRRFDTMMGEIISINHGDLLRNGLGKQEVVIDHRYALPEELKSVYRSDVENRLHYLFLSEAGVYQFD